MDKQYKDVHIIERNGNEICVQRMVETIIITGNSIICKNENFVSTARVIIPIMDGTKILID